MSKTTFPDPENETDVFTKIHIERNDKQTDADRMFYVLTKLTTFTANPNTFGNVTDMDYTWFTCNSLTSFPKIDTSKVTYMDCPWSDCSALTSFPAIDISKVTKLWRSWYNCTSLVTIQGLTNNGVAPDDVNVFVNTPALTRPTAAEQTSILNGNSYHV